MLDTLRSVVRFRRFEFDANKRRLATAANTDDLRRIAKRRLPGGVFDYIDGGAEDERTMRANREAFSNYRFRPRVLRDVSAVDTSTSLLGKAIPLPLVLAPTGFTRIADPQGELAVARAAQRAGLPYTLSTLSTRSIEEVAAANGDGRRWFQVYVWKDKGLLRDMVDRAAAAGYEALVITVDTANLGRRERDVRRGFELPPKLGLGTIVDGAVHPSWTWRFVRAEPIRFANIASSAAATDQPEGSSAVNLAETFATQFDARLSWDDVDWFRSVWNGPIVIKGIQTVDDAGSPPTSASTPSPCPTTAAGNSTTLRRRSTSSPRSPTRSAVASRSSATAACAGAATSSRRSPSGPRRAWPAGRTSTGSPPAASSASTRSSSCSPATSAGRWRCSARRASRSCRATTSNVTECR